MNRMNQTSEINQAPDRFKVCSVEFLSKAVARAVAPASFKLFPEDDMSKKEPNNGNKSRTRKIQSLQCRVALQRYRKSSRSSNFNLVTWQSHEQNKPLWQKHAYGKGPKSAVSSCNSKLSREPSLQHLSSNSLRKDMSKTPNNGK